MANEAVAVDETGAGAGAAAASSGTGVEAGTGTPGAGTTADGAAAAAAARTGGAAGATQFTYPEDRSKWVPPHRLRESTSRAQQMERDLALERQRVAALSGVTPPAAEEDDETRAIRGQLERLYPALKKFRDVPTEKLDQLLSFDPSTVNRSEENYWTAIGTQTLGRLENEFVKVLGATELTPFQRGTLTQAFTVYLQSDPSLMQRYVGQDPKLVSDFIKEYQTHFLDPYRRTITTNAAPRGESVRRLPRGGNSTAVAPGQSGRGALKPTDSDEYHDAASAAFFNSQRAAG